MDVSRVITVCGFIAIGLALLGVHYLGKRRTNRIPSFADLCGFMMRERWAARRAVRLAVAGLALPGPLLSTPD